MLNEHQINMLPERICERLAGINTEYLEIIGNLIKEVGELRPTDVHRLQRMYDTGADLHRISLMLAEVSDKNVQDIYDAFDIVARDNYEYSRPFFEAQAMQFIPYEENENLQRYVKSVAKQTAGDYINLTQHTAFAVFDPGGKSIAPLFAKNKDKVATSLSDTYTKIMDYAVTKVQLGETDYQSAMREVQKAMVNSGIKTVDYATGYKRRLDTAVRQNVLWGLKECNQNTADMIGEEFGADGYEISYHSNPRPSHADMGGRQYAKGEARTVKGVYYPSFEKEAEPLLNEYGCLHFKFSILLGISRPVYSNEQLEQMKAEDKQTFEFEGKEYTRYEASQLQRKIETAVRHEKDLANMAKASGNDDLRREAQYKINLLTSKYAQLSKASGLPTKMERMQVGGFRRVKEKIPLTKEANGGIMKEQLSELGKFKEKLQSDSAVSKEYYSVIKERFSHGSDTAKAVFNKYVLDNSVVDGAYEGTPCYSSQTKKIRMHYGADMQNPRGNGITYFHEHGHLIDDVAGCVSNDKTFKDLLDADVMAYRKNYGKAHGIKTFDKVDAAISKELDSMRKHSGVSDIFDALTNGNISGVARHDSDYWISAGKIESEAFAHMFASEFDNVRHAEMKKYFPQSLSWFESKLKEMIK